MKNAVLAAIGSLYGTEFKFCIDDTSLVDKILNDSMLDDYVDRNALEVIDMKAVYFDTDDLDLRKAGIAYRVRYENDRITATVKWDNKVEDGLHSREVVQFSNKR